MMKSAVLVLALAAFVHAQNRPYYASRPVGVPEMLDQFKPTDGLGNRVGDADDAAANVPLKADDGIGGDPYLTPRLADFPKEHQPFWFLNSKQIMQHRGQKVPEERPAEEPAEVEAPVVADPPARRPTGQVRRPAKVPARPVAPDVDVDVSERRQGGPRYNNGPRRPTRPNTAFRAATQEADADPTEPRRRPAPGRKERPAQGWQFGEKY